MTRFAAIPAPLTHQSDGHRHAWEALDGYARGFMDVCNFYSRPFKLTGTLILPHQPYVRLAMVRGASAISLLQRSLRVQS